MEEYRLIGERLEKELLDVGKEKHYRDLIELIDRIADYIFKESPRVKKGIGEIMGGQVLELESERLERLIREGCEAARVDFTGFKGTKKHRPRGNRFVRKNSAFSAPSGVRTLDTLIKSQTHVRKSNARTPRRMGVRGTPPSSTRTLDLRT